MSYGHPTTRRYCRTLREAWPREHGNPIEHVYSRPMWRTVCFVAAIIIGAVLALGA